jgi:hypothetical protein
MRGSKPRSGLGKVEGGKGYSDRTKDPIWDHVFSKVYFLARKCRRPGYTGIGDVFQPINYWDRIDFAFFRVKWERCDNYGQGDKNDYPRSDLVQEKYRWRK